jgi:DNA-binding CsgD family transcriptional regulator
MIGSFIEHACLNEEEIAVLNDLAYGKSLVESAMKNNMSDSKVSNIRHMLRIKYDRIQPYCNDLPPRKKTK